MTIYSFLLILINVILFIYLENLKLKFFTALINICNSKSKYSNTNCGKFYSIGWIVIIKLQFATLLVSI